MHRLMQSDVGTCCTSVHVHVMQHAYADKNRRGMSAHVPMSNLLCLCLCMAGWYNMPLWFVFCALCFERRMCAHVKSMFL